MAQLAEAEAEAAAERALEAARCAAAEGRGVRGRSERGGGASEGPGRRGGAACGQSVRSRCGTRSLGTLWTNDRRPVTTPAAAGSSRRQLQGMSHVGNSIENGNRLGERPVVRQSKLYRQNESGNAMKAALGHDELKWETDALQGVFAGRQGLYDA